MKKKPVMGVAITTSTNRAYEMVKLGGEGGEVDGEYDLVGDPSSTIVGSKIRTSHLPLPAIPLTVTPPTCGDVSVAKEHEEEGAYDIPGEQ